MMGRGAAGGLQIRRLGRGDECLAAEIFAVELVKSGVLEEPSAR